MTAWSQVPAQSEPAGDAADAIEPPHALAPLTVDYPEGASGEAMVELALTIDAEGLVRSATVTRGNEPFASAARERATGWRFSPALRQAKPIASVIRVEVRFTPPEPPESEPSPAPESPSATLP